MDSNKKNFAEEKVTLEAQLKSLEEEKEKLEEENQKLKLSRLRAEAVEFCESEDVKTRLKPALKNKVVEALITAKSSEEFEFSEGDETKTATVYETIQELVKELPEFEFSEIAKKEENGNSGFKTNEEKIGEEMAKLVS